MNEKLFRKASLDRVNSPEQLNEYIRVARPGVWIALSAIVLLLLGVVIWGVFGSVETTIDALAVVRQGEATLYIAAEEASRAEVGMSVRIGEATGAIRSISDSPAPLADLAQGDALAAGRISAGASCYAASVEVSGLADGVFAAEIVAESIHPIRFVTQ